MANVSFSVCNLDARLEPTSLLACAAPTCEGPWREIGVLTIEHRNWAYVLGINGVSFDGSASTVQNMADPHEGPQNATVFSVRPVAHRHSNTARPRTCTQS
jgi:hypothetical protein